MKIVFAICLVLSFSEPVHSQSKKLEPPGPVEIAKAKIAIREAFGSEIEKAKTRRQEGAGRENAWGGERCR